MSKFKMFVILIFFGFPLVLYSDIYEYKNKATAMSDNTLITKYNLFDYDSMLSLLLDLSDEDDYANFVLGDALMEVNQLKFVLKEKIKIDSSDVIKAYVSYAMSSDLTVKEYFKYMFEHGLSFKMIRSFLEASIQIQKLHDKKLMNDLFVGKKEVFDYLNYTNSYDIKHYFNLYSFLQISYSEATIFKIRETYTLLKLANLENVIGYVKDEDGFIDFFKVDLGDVRNRIIAEYIELYANEEIVGPIYENSKIFFLKVIKIESKFMEDEIDLKVQHYFIKKNLNLDISDNLEIRRHNVNNLERIIRKFNRYGECDDFAGYSNTEYLNKKSLDKDFYDVIKDLSKNEFSDILEFVDGWHLIRFISKEYNVFAKPYKVLTSIIMERKLALARKEYIRVCKSESYRFLLCQ